MEISVDGNDFRVLAGKLVSVSNETKRAVSNEVSRASLDLQANIKLVMPVDTGAARASWGSPNAAGIWDVMDEGWSITQGSTLPYIGRLNEGWSKQAPAGFIDTEHERAVDKFVESIGAVIGDALK